MKREFFEVQYCSQAVLGVRPDQGVVLCHNNLMTRTDMENMLTHELVHAYDHCRCAPSQAFDRRCGNRSPPSPPRAPRLPDPSYPVPPPRPTAEIIRT